jgi:hypothetical protein
MLRDIALAGAFALLIAAPALADQDHGRGQRGNHHDAPEPLTIIGLAVGGAGVAYGRWNKRRRGGAK